MAIFIMGCTITLRTSKTINSHYTLIFLNETFNLNKFKITYKDKYFILIRTILFYLDKKQT